MMGRNFDDLNGAQEIASRHNTDGAHNDIRRGSPGSKIAALALAVSAGTAITALPAQAEAEPTRINFVKFVGTAKGSVSDSVFTGDAVPDGWFTDTKVSISIDLKRIFTGAFLEELEGQKVEFDLDGEIKNGVYTGKVEPKGSIWISGRSHCVRPEPDCTPRPRDCSWPPCRAPRRSAAPARPPLSPEPSAAEFGETGVRLIKSLKPFDPGTFYADKPEAGKDMGEGHPRGFDIKKGESLTFFVTGEAQSASGKTSVFLELHPWVSTDEKKRGHEKLKVKVKIDGEEFEIVPRPLPKGKILPSSTTSDNSLWDTPVPLPKIPVPSGTHEITITPDGYDIRAVLRGATETVKPDVDPAIEYAFEEDPNLPQEFSANVRLTTAADATSGYALEPITPSPVKINFGDSTGGFNIRIQRLPNSPLVLVHLEKGKKGEVDYAAYVSEKPLEPETDYRVRFTRVAPAARSYNAAESPGALVLHVRATVDAATGLVTAFEIDKSATAPQLPGTMTCNVNNVAAANPKRAHLFCAEQAADESRIRALRARMDNRPTNPAGKFRRHVLRAY